ncbi:PREDICTED: snRNA-activating protein complex subunit 1 [Dufourea novaeangliae]|uniref:snRNA-activating protein complex subunit 1 n=1 Tax=Dufourea novaeangliae TaxID=178035 RepID=A0A154P1Q2_DUFNO|nr:PREDICTED: snRNA-activating protein complex subunit 1 [Dufourea novaeangliae]KZC05752.1 snRNA-activating protein complex subunit 1 [Dufourea novaeangliae]
MGTDKSLILSGFKEDCEELLSRFEQANDIRFQTFCEIWKEMKFSLVFTGRPAYIELLEFCEEALNICKKFLFLPSRFKERIGGLYLLYGIYYKMPTNQFKIRIKLDDCKSIKDLHAEIKEAEHLDANYILCKLIADNAFHFCIFDKEYGLEKHYRTKESQVSFNPYSVLPALKDLTDKHQMLSEIDALCKSYEEKKQKLVATNKSSNSLNLFDANIAAEIINDIREFEEQRRNQQTQNSSAASTSRGEYKKKSIGKAKMRPLLNDASQTDSNESDEDGILEIDFDSDKLDSE